ncbi:hypothetical protein SAMN05661096_03613 [Marivirga sericea]|uniref:Uncharacterized protein n=1 Tax=Marivirga sericea TaxID=1028 RepID=A0A1X7L854_9BACT|nr:hypothetical protein [Marivirga sericea]SMG49442.1 hypothetical protein SAMN05661096_03613 [Marivirga sericea]
MKELKVTYHNPEEELRDRIILLLSQIKKKFKQKKSIELKYDINNSNKGSPDVLDMKVNLIELINSRSEIDYRDLRNQIFIKSPKDWIELVKSENATVLNQNKSLLPIVNFIHSRIQNVFEFIPIINLNNIKGIIHITLHPVEDYLFEIDEIIFDNVSDFVAEDDQKRLEESFPGISRKEKIIIIRPDLIRYSLNELQNSNILTISEDDIDSFIMSFGSLMGKHKGNYKFSYHFINSKIRFHDLHQASFYLRRTLALWIKHRCIEGFNTDISKVFSSLFSTYSLRGLSYDSVRNNLKLIKTERYTDESTFKAELSTSLKKKPQ